MSKYSIIVFFELLVLSVQSVVRQQYCLDNKLFYKKEYLKMQSFITEK